MPATATLVPVQCPTCSDHHALIAEPVGHHVIYRCDRTGDEFVAESEPVPTAYDVVGEVTTTRAPATFHTTLQLKQEPGETDATMAAPRAAGAEAATFIGGYAPSVTMRGSVLTYLKSAYRGKGEPESAYQAKYQVGEQIAEGGMGVVWMAEDVDLHRQVAMKTLLTRHVPSPAFVSKFLEEAQTIGQLEHPNIVPVYDVGMHPTGELYFTMKYVRGQTLQAVIERLRSGDPAMHARYSWTRRAQIVQAICDALEFAHRRGVIHRDLKPANIMIGEFGEVQVMDWGIAKRFATAEAGAAPGDPLAIPSESPVNLTAINPHHTRAGSLMGTAYYMSPEQASGHAETLTPASDIYSLGAVMYELFGLQRAHNGGSVAEVLIDVIKHHPAPLQTLKQAGQGAVPIELEYIARRAMAKTPGDRFASAADLKHDLQLFLDGEYPIVCPHTALKRGSTALSHLVDNHAKGLILTLLIGLAAVAVGGIAALAF